MVRRLTIIVLTNREAYKMKKLNLMTDTQLDAISGGMTLLGFSDVDGVSLLKAGINVYAPNDASGTAVTMVINTILAQGRDLANIQPFGTAILDLNDDGIGDVPFPVEPAF